MIVNIQEVFLKNSSIKLNVNFSFEEKGTLYIIKGRNGSGKTILLKTIAGIISKYEGSISPKDGLASFCFSNLNLMGNLKVRTNLLGLNSISNNRLPIEKMNQMIDAFSLRKFMNHTVASTSSGTSQKVNIILGLGDEAHYYFFDEPCNFLDQESRLVFWNYIKDKLIQKKTVIITSHADEHQNIDFEIANTKTYNL